VAETNVDAQLLEQARRQVQRLAEEIAQLSEAELTPAEYYGEFLQRILAAISAPAGAVWVRSPQGNLVLQYQTRMREVGLDLVENGRQIHDELLRQSVMKGQPVLMPPHSGLGMPGDEGPPQAGNPTNFVTLIAPILVDKQVAGLVEVWQDPNRGPDAQRGFLQFMIKMAALAANYTRNHQLRQMSSQQQVWTQLEAFARQIHASLHTTEVAYLVANEGRRLVECDRISIGMREGGSTHVRAISGADIIEKRSNLVKLMRALFDAVLAWGEKLVFSGTKDESLPPKVLYALDNYLAESNSKLLVVMPLRDDREKGGKKQARSVMMMECFEPQGAPEQLTARLEVVAKHAASALYNASEYRNIPFRFVWLPLARVQEGLGGKTKAIISLIALAVFVLLIALIVVPYPLKIDANGQLMPSKWQSIFAPYPGQVRAFKPNLDQGKAVSTEQNLIRLYSQELDKEILEINLQIKDAVDKSKSYAELISREPKSPKAAEWRLAKTKSDALRSGKLQELEKLRLRANADQDDPGYFWARSPLKGIVLSYMFKENLLYRYVQPNEPLLKVGYVSYKSGKYDPEDWELELKIPQKHVGQVLKAFETNDPEEELDVDFLLSSNPTEVFKGRLARKKISPAATPDWTDNNEAQPVVYAWVRIQGKDIPKESQLPPELLLTGTGVHARVRCGDHPMGYSLFYGVWEWFYDRVVFFF
jgi:hypothetical protein